MLKRACPETKLSPNPPMAGKPDVERLHLLVAADVRRP
jgi:hypothetical protein